MSLVRQIAVEADISQQVILGKIIRYLTLYHRPPALIKVFNSGHCTGYTALALYSLFLLLHEPKSYNEFSQPVPRDDWLSIKNDLTRISTWDESAQSLKGNKRYKKKLRRSFERIIALIRSLQRPDFLPNATQMKIFDNLQDTRHRIFIQEYSFGALLTANDYTKPINIKSANQLITTTLLECLVKENRLVFIPSFNHTIGVIKHKNFYFFFDSNLPDGWVVLTGEQSQALINEFYEANHFVLTQASPLMFNVVCTNTMTPESYFPSDVLLSALEKSSIVRGEDANSPTALYLATEVGCRDLFYYYLYHSPIALNAYVSVASRCGEAPLHVAAIEGHEDLVQVLLLLGANLNAKTAKLSTAILLATQTNRIGIVNELLRMGANPNIANVDGFTPLFCAASENFLVVMNLLLTYKARPNQKAIDGNTALHVAAWRDNLAAVKLLLAYKADVNVKNNLHLTPLLVALHCEKMHIAECLIRHPAIVIQQREYEYLLRLRKKYSDNQQIQNWLELASPLFIVYFIKSQLLLFKHQHEKFHRDATQQLRSAIVLLPTFSSAQEKIQFLMRQMLPILSQAPTCSSSKFWKKPDLAATIKLRLKKWNISIEEEYLSKPMNVRFNK
ncbi:MAG: ankyrin repeat domain-containing protein [Gammaproteobacteria bacterium]|nr:ankyrin repeat domain-containing protein [Gammaproteobacteria bacterium]